jgi:phosphatidylinositol-3-phosphatase
MEHTRGRMVFPLGVLALITLGSLSVSAQEIKTVLVIAMENHHWTQPVQLPGKIQQIYQNSNAPFINRLVNGTAFAVINGAMVNISAQTAYATAYHNVLATPSGNNPHIHPSEPNYLWAEAGTNFNVFNDNDPFSPNGPTNQNT